MGIPAGPDLGKKLQAAADYWLAGDFKASKADLLKYIESMSS